MIRKMFIPLLLLSFALTSCATLPVFVTEQEKINREEFKQKLTTAKEPSFKLGPLSKSGFDQMIRLRINSYQNDKNLNEAQKKKKIDELKTKVYEDGKWYFFEVMYEKAPFKQPFYKLTLTDAKGQQYFKWSSTTTTVQSMTMKMGKDVQKLYITQESVLLESAEPIRKKTIEPERMPFYYTVIIFKNNILKYKVLPQ